MAPDSFEGRVWRGGDHRNRDNEVLCSLLQNAVDSNMNMLRIWGGGIFPQDAFFDCADRFGILLQQDGIFSNRAYPTTGVALFPLSHISSHKIDELSS